MVEKLQMVNKSFGSSNWKSNWNEYIFWNQATFTSSPSTCHIMRIFHPPPICLVFQVKASKGALHGLPLKSSLLPSPLLPLCKLTAVTRIRTNTDKFHPHDVVIHPCHTVILPDWTFKKWGHSNFAFQYCYECISTHFLRVQFSKITVCNATL